MKELSNIKGAIFDLDGTLFDSMRVWSIVDEKFLTKRNLPVSNEYKEAVRTMHFAEAAAYTINRYSLNETPEDIMNEWLTLTKESYHNDVTLKPYAKEFLIALREKGVKLGIATSSKPDLFLHVLEKFGVRELFSSYSLTDESPRGKAFPDLYLLEANKLGVSPADCAIFEDILIGIQGAKRGGFTTAAVYDFSAQTDEEELKKQADYYFESFKQALTLI